MINKKLNAPLRLILVTALLVLAFPALGADKPAAPAAITKPAWLTEISIGVKEVYDDNVLGVSGDGPMRTEGSWVTTISPKLGFNLLPLFGKPKSLQTFSFGYAPDFVTYHNDTIGTNLSHESFNLHRFTTVLKGKVDTFSFSFDNAVAYVDGDRESPVYSFPTDSTRAGYSTGFPRERREQVQDRAKVALQYDWEKWFIRPTAALTYYDLLTRQKNLPGYQNYADRYDVNGGADLGYRINPQLAVTLGYRYGHQYQQAYFFSPTKHAPNDYHRALLGIEGKPWKWLTVSFQAGPDFRSYESATDASVKDADPVKYYGEGNLVVNATANDTVTFKYRQWQWVVSTGRIPYYDSSFDLTYRRKFSKDFFAELGARMLEADYTTGSLPNAQRIDQQYSVAASLNYAVNANLALNLTYSLDLGRNAEDAVPANMEKYREFDRQVVGLGAVFKF